MVSCAGRAWFYDYADDHEFLAVEVENQIPSSSLLPDHLPQNYNDSPVFYGPDGQIITEEESNFLNCPANYAINIDDIIEWVSNNYLSLSSL